MSSVLVTGAQGCCKHVSGCFYHLLDIFESDVNEVPDIKTCTNLLQK